MKIDGYSIVLVYDLSLVSRCFLLWKCVRFCFCFCCCFFVVVVVVCTLFLFVVSLIFFHVPPLGFLK